MAKVEAKHDLLEELEGLVLLQAPALHQVVKELPALHVLEDEEELLVRLVHVVQLHDVRVLDQLHDGDLPLQLLHHAGMLLPGIRRVGAQVLLVGGLEDDLDGHRLPRLQVLAELDPACVVWCGLGMQVRRSVSAGSSHGRVARAMRPERRATAPLECMLHRPSPSSFA